MTRSPNLEEVSTRLQRIAQLAREDAERIFMSLAHHIDRDFLREAYRRTRKDGALGVDGQTAAAYEEDLDENLQSLLDRFKSGRYKAPPVRRTYIPKGSDPTKRRPIGVPTFEDKVLQRAVTMVLEAGLKLSLAPIRLAVLSGSFPLEARLEWRALHGGASSCTADWDLDSSGAEGAQRRAAGRAPSQER